MAKDNLGYYDVYPYKKEEEMADFDEDTEDYDDDGVSDYDKRGI